MQELMSRYKEVLITGPIGERELQDLYDRSAVLIRFGFNEKDLGWEFWRQWLVAGQS